VATVITAGAVTGETITDEQIAMVREQAVIEGNAALIRFCDQAMDPSRPDLQRKSRQFVAAAYNRMFPDGVVDDE
jgi:hypothetical protein